MGTFEIVGMTFGILGMSFGIIAFSRLGKLEKHLKESGVLDKNYK